MRPAIVNLEDHTKEDTWEGMVIGPITINEAAPTYPVVSCRIQFRLASTKALGYELNNDPGAGEGNITIDDADTWEFTVPAQFLVMDAGDYEWDFETIDSAGRKRTFYSGTISIIQDNTHD